MQTWVLTAIGPDRPGLVEALSDAIARHHGNWLESRMARMAGHFAGIVSVQVPPEHASDLTEALRTLAARGLEVSVTPSEIASSGSVRSIAISLVGNDRKGIVRDVSAALARHAVNVDELVTEFTHGAMSGEAIFRASARVTIPAEVSMDSLRKELEKVADDLMVDLSVADVPS